MLNNANSQDPFRFLNKKKKRDVSQKKARPLAPELTQKF